MTAPLLAVSVPYLEVLEALSYIVTVVAFPFAIWIFIKEQRKERANDDEEVYLKLADDYESFLKLVLENADLRLLAPTAQTVTLTPEQLERRHVLFEILIAQLERAYILVYEEKMSRQVARLWQTWEDYMRSWCRRADFRGQLEVLLEGEDPEFQAYIRRVAQEEAGQAASRPRHAPPTR
jgi:hypothetical protein